MWYLNGKGDILCFFKKNYMLTRLMKYLLNALVKKSTFFNHVFTLLFGTPGFGRWSQTLPSMLLRSSWIFWNWWSRFSIIPSEVQKVYDVNTCNHQLSNQTRITACDVTIPWKSEWITEWEIYKHRQLSTKCQDFVASHFTSKHLHPLQLLCFLCVYIILIKLFEGFLIFPPH